jgi:hypothetical protein
MGEVQYDLIRHCEEAQPTKQSRASSRLWIASLRSR